MSDKPKGSPELAEAFRLLQTPGLPIKTIREMTEEFDRLNPPSEALKASQELLQQHAFKLQKQRQYEIEDRSIRQWIAAERVRFMRELNLEPNTLFIPEEGKINFTIWMRNQAIYYTNTPGPDDQPMSLDGLKVVFMQGLSALKVGYIHE